MSEHFNNMNKSWWNSVWTRRFADALAFVLVSAGVCHLVMGSALFTYEWWVSFAAVFFAYLIWSAVFANRWTVLATAVLICAAALTGWFFYRDTSMYMWREFLRFADWAYKYITGEAFIQTHYTLPLAIVCYAAISLWVFLCTRWFLMFWLLFAAVAGFFGLLWAIGHNILPYLAVSLAGIFMYYARAHDERNQEIASRTYSGVPRPVSLDAAPRAMAQTGALALAALIIGAALTFVPEDTGRLRSPWLVTQLGDINDFVAQYVRLTAPVARTGFTSSATRLGGEINLSHGEALRVETSHPAPLKGNVLNHYSGNSWNSNLPASQHRLGSAIWNSTQNEVFDLSRPDLSAVPEKYRQEVEAALFTEVSLTVTHLSGDTSVMFAPGRVRRVDIGDSGNIGDSSNISDSSDSGDTSAINPHFDQNGALFSQGILPASSSYTVQTRLVNKGTAAFDAAMKYLMTLPLSDNSEKRKTLETYYLSLPQTIPDTVAVVAGEVTRDAVTPYDKAVAIETFLLSNFTYTLTPATPPARTDFVTYFLRSREGYCTYFASAMVVMARAVELPSRYVEGYLPGTKTEVSDEYIITDANAHAWAEIYFDGIGWIPFDATLGSGAYENEQFENEQFAAIPSFSAETDGSSLDGQYAAGQDELAPQENLSDVPQPETQQENDQQTGQENGQPETDTQAYSKIPEYENRRLAIAIFTALLCVIAITCLIHKYKSGYAYLCRKYKNPHARLTALYLRLQALFALYGERINPGDTPHTFAARIDGWLSLPEGTMGQVADDIVLSRFGEIPPEHDELARVYAFSRALQHGLRKKLGFPLYYVKWVLKHKKLREER